MLPDEFELLMIVLIGLECCNYPTKIIHGYLIDFFAFVFAEIKSGKSNFSFVLMTVPIQLRLCFYILLISVFCPIYFRHCHQYIAPCDKSQAISGPFGAFLVRLVGLVGLVGLV